MDITLATNTPLPSTGRVIASATETRPEHGNGEKPKVVRVTYSLYPEQKAFVSAQARALNISESKYVREVLTQEQSHGLVPEAGVQRALAAKRKLKTRKHKK